jgi:hypothetical protein
MQKVHSNYSKIKCTVCLSVRQSLPRLCKEEESSKAHTLPSTFFRLANKTSKIGRHCPPGRRKVVCGTHSDSLSLFSFDFNVWQGNCDEGNIDRRRVVSAVLFALLTAPSAKHVRLLRAKSQWCKAKDCSKNIGLSPVRGHSFWNTLCSSSGYIFPRSSSCGRIKLRFDRGKRSILP